MLLEVAVILALALINGLLAGAEIAIVGIDRATLAQLVERGGRRARAVMALRENPERLFATVQVGITVIGASAGAFGGTTFADDLEPLLLAVLPSFGPNAHGASIAIAVATVSFFTIVLGELVPKSLALRSARRYALLAGPLLLFLSAAVRPLVWLLTSVSNLVLRFFGDKTTFSETRLSREELRELVDQATETGSVHPAAGKIAARAFDFAGLTASQVMVPRSHVLGIPRNASNDEIQRIALEHGYSRLPVYGESLDDVVGYVMVKDMLALAWEGRLFVLDDLLRPPYFVVESMRAPDLLQQLRERRSHIAFVVDERGGTAGIVTIEDLLEELVGEIVSEHAGSEPESLSRQPDGSFLVRGDLPIRELNRELSLNLPEGDGWSTLGGLCMIVAGRVPRVGESLRLDDGTLLIIVASSERVVLRVRVVPAPRAAPTS